MPDASLPTVEEANGMSSNPSLTPAQTGAAPAVAGTASAYMPTQPQSTRRSRLGSLFAGIGFNRIWR
jgi:hypothetical protein